MTAEESRPSCLTVALAPFVLTRHDYDTPLRSIETDPARVDRLAAACERDRFEDGDARRVRGLPCIYSALRAAGGKLLDFGYAHDLNGGIVTYSAIAAAQDRESRWRPRP